MEFQHRKVFIKKNCSYFFKKTSLHIHHLQISLNTPCFHREAQRSVRKLANQLCKLIDMRLVFTTFKIKHLFRACLHGGDNLLKKARNSNLPEDWSRFTLEKGQTTNLLRKTKGSFFS